MTTCDRDRRAVATTPPSSSRSIRHNETYATDDVSTFVDQILRFELLVRTLEYLIGDSSHFAILYHALFLVPSFLLRSSFFFFSFLFHRWYRVFFSAESQIIRRVRVRI